MSVHCCVHCAEQWTLPTKCFVLAANVHGVREERQVHVTDCPAEHKLHAALPGGGFRSGLPAVVPIRLRLHSSTRDSPEKRHHNKEKGEKSVLSSLSLSHSLSISLSLSLSPSQTRSVYFCSLFITLFLLSLSPLPLSVYFCSLFVSLFSLSLSPALGLFLSRLILLSRLKENL